MQSGVSIRIIKDNRLGFAYTKKLQKPEELMQNALNSLKGGVEAKYTFPHTEKLPELNTYDRTIDEATNTVVVEEGRRICSILEAKTKAQVNIYAGTTTGEIQVRNSSNSALRSKTSYYTMTPRIIYPGSATGIYRSLFSKSFQKADHPYLDTLAELYNRGKQELTMAGGKMRALFMPEAMYTLIWRLQSATNGQSLYHKQSPLADKLGKRIFDERLTISDNALDDSKPGARAFDDEGMACQRLPIIEKGALLNYYYDLYYASKMHAEPTGHGFKTAFLPGDLISMKPTPTLQNVTIEPGEKEFWQIIREMDRGIIVCGALGAHSGNIPNGDFSIGLSPGLYVEKGEITGRIKDAMVAGNIYEMMQQVIDIENIVHPASTGYYPAILFDNVSVATKN
jgi:PmbA protein